MVLQTMEEDYQLGPEQVFRGIHSDWFGGKFLTALVIANVFIR